MVKLKITKTMLTRANRHKIIAKGVVNGRKIVAVSGAIGDWAAYMDYFDQGMTWKKIADGGAKIYTTEVNDYFTGTKKVMEMYRR